MGIAMSLWWEKLLRAFVSGQSGVRSGNSIDLHVFGYKTQCCTQFKSPGDKILCVLYLHYNVAFTFKCMEIPETKSFIPKGFELGTALS